ncbi:unnamed protein product, partial [Closterium sp. NIES-54]
DSGHRNSPRVSPSTGSATLSDAVPDEIGSLVNLTALDLSNNGLTGDLPDSLNVLSFLLRLVLANNQLTGPLPQPYLGANSKFFLDARNNLFTGPPRVKGICPNARPTKLLARSPHACGSLAAPAACSLLARGPLAAPAARLPPACGPLAAPAARWAELLRSGVDIFDLDYDAILAAMYALSVSAESDCYMCVPPDPGIEATALGASESGTLPGIALAEALHTFTLSEYYALACSGVLYSEYNPSRCPRWLELLRSGVDIFALDYDAILAAMYALSVSAEGDCYLCVPRDPQIEAASLGASESALPGTAPAEALHTFTLDSDASRCFFRDNTTLTSLPALVPVRLADPSGGPVLARSSTTLPCPAVPSGSLSSLHLPSFFTNLVSTAALQDAMVTTTTPGGQRVSICTCTQTGRHLAMFTRRPGSSLYTLATEPPQVAASAKESASGPVAAPCSCRLLTHQTLLWHHRLGHPSLPRLRGMHSRLLVSGLPRSLPPLPPSLAPPYLPCVEGRQLAAPHSSFPPTTTPLQSPHMDVWGPARVNGQGRERYFLLVVDDYTRYTTVFPLRSKGEVPDVFIPWIRAVRLQLRERFREDLPVLRLHSDRGGEFSSDLLQDVCRGEGILQSFTLLASPQQNRIAEHRIGLVMEVARTSMIHAAAPHFLWPFVVRYAAHQLNLWPRVSLRETSPPLRWMRKVGDASVFQVWGSRAFVRNNSADKLSSRAIPCVFLGFPQDARGWQFYQPTSRRVLPSQDVTFDESVFFYRLFPYSTAPFPPPTPHQSFLPQVLLRPTPRDSGAARGATSGGAASGGAEPVREELGHSFLTGQPARGDLAAPPTWLHWVVSCRYSVEPPSASLWSPPGASRREWHDTLRMTLAALGFAPSSADLSRFLRTDTSLLSFYVLMYVDNLVFATSDTTALAFVNSELQKRFTCTDLGEVRNYLGLQITRDRARRTITLTQSYMVHRVLQRFGFWYSLPQSTPLPTSHSLSAPPLNESIEPSGMYVELVGCLMVLRYLCSTSGMGHVLGGWGPVVLTGHANAFWVDDLATQWSSQGYTFSLGSGSVSWRSTRSSSVLSSSCEAEIYTGAMAAKELRWLTYLLTDLGERPRSSLVLYVDNKAMIALC